MTLTIVLSERGQRDGSPTGVADQSTDRIVRAASPGTSSNTPDTALSTSFIDLSALEAPAATAL